MPVKAVSFDAAGTLVNVAWDPSQIALDAADSIGLELADKNLARATYKSMLRDRWHVFVELNLQRSQEICDQFWLDMSHDWLARIGADTGLTKEIYDVAQKAVFGQESHVFTLFKDTAPTLDALTQAGIPLVVVSNWDVSLHRVLDMLGITEHFHTVLASLEEGVEKPDPRLFEIALGRIGAEPSEVLHVGDDPIADVEGAINAGLQALLLDRSLDCDKPHAIASLQGVLGRL